MATKTNVMREISPEWDRLMRLAEAIGRGKATITFNDGRPVHCEEVIKKIDLDSDEDFNQKLKTIPII